MEGTDERERSRGLEREDARRTAREMEIRRQNRDGEMMGGDEKKKDRDETVLHW